jgi:hypothetical protein
MEAGEADNGPFAIGPAGDLLVPLSDELVSIE